jgi:16S rRNA (uracil1498-N3)-methyltransferase
MAKIHRFIDNFDLSQKELQIEGEIANQIIKVLKLRIGEKVELGNGKDAVAFGEIKEKRKKDIVIKIERIIKKKECEKQTTLFCAILKKENFELVVQKTTECGIHKIVPIVTSRTIKNGLNIERLKRIVKEACEQSGRFTLPEINEVISFEKSLDLTKENDTNILFDMSGLPLDDKNINSKKIGIWIGPEGGWTEEEIKKTRDISSFAIKSLGTNILRAETAAIISSYLISHLK